MRALRPVEVKARGETYEVHAHGTIRDVRVYRVIVRQVPTGKENPAFEPKREVRRVSEKTTEFRDVVMVFRKICEERA